MHFLPEMDPFKLLAYQWPIKLARYFIVVGLVYFIFWKLLFHRWQDRFLYSSKPGSKHIIREITYSVLSTLIFLLPTIIMIFLKPYKVSKLYFNLHDYPLWWYALSYLIIFVLHDTYFYWTHRLMHTKLLYPSFHKVHHLSVSPTPWAAFAFHPLEALVQPLVFVIVILLVPTHWTVLVFFSLFSLVMNVYGHLGFHLFSAKLRAHALLKYLSHSGDHSWHHKYYHGNYGFYLKFWDHIMGTYQGELKK